MQNRHHTDAPSDIPGIGGQLEQRLGGGFHEQAIEDLLMPAHTAPELLRYRKDHMIIRDRQEVFLSRLQPCLGVARVAFRTTAVATRVVRILQPSAVITRKDMASQGGRTASQDILESTAMTRGHPFAERVQVLCAVASQDVGHFEHGNSPADQPRFISWLIFF